MDAVTSAARDESAADAVSLPEFLRDTYVVVERIEGDVAALAGEVATVKGEVARRTYALGVVCDPAVRARIEEAEAGVGLDDARPADELVSRLQSRLGYVPWNISGEELLLPGSRQSLT